MKWFLFPVSWFYDISLNFQSCLAFLSWLFARFLSLFVLSAIIINRFWSDFWCCLSFFLRFLVMNSFYDPQIDAAHSNCQFMIDQLILIFRGSIYIFFLFMIVWIGFLKFFVDSERNSMERKIQTFVMRKVWSLICSKCMMLYVMWRKKSLRWLLRIDESITETLN